jgi:hypothetical protein
MFFLCLAGFSLLDTLMEVFNAEGRYYANHALANAAIVSLTAKNVVDCYLMKFEATPDAFYTPKAIVYGLHVYHMIIYHNKMRFDDWLHHGLMVGVALPLTEVVPASTILGHSMFFINGLPGMIDYSLLFLARNNYISKLTEKKANRLLNIWVRCPGCVMTAGFILMNIKMHHSIVQKIASFAMAGCVYWNGVYFMDQVVRDYAQASSNKAICRPKLCPLRL